MSVLRTLCGRHVRAPSIKLALIAQVGAAQDIANNKRENGFCLSNLRIGSLLRQMGTETNRWYFPDARTIDKTSEVKLPDGTSMNFEFKGTRQ